MSSTTATVLVGTTHPNDGTICPTHIARLVEGDRACWVLDALTPAASQCAWVPSAPERVVVDLLAVLELHVGGARAPRPALRRPFVEPEVTDHPAVDDLAARFRHRDGLALTVSISPQSSLYGHLDEFRRGLRSIDVEILECTWSRKWSAWTGGWVETDRPVTTVDGNRVTPLSDNGPLEGGHR